MFNAKGIFLSLFVLLIGCTVISSAPQNPEADFELSCSRWDPKIIVCEDHIETDPITGHLKVWYFENDLYYGTTIFVCGANLVLNTGNPIEDFVGESETKDELLCVNGNDESVEWSWDDDAILEINWENLYLEINIPECPYDEKICVIESYGYIAIE